MNPLAAISAAITEAQDSMSPVKVRFRFKTKPDELCYCCEPAHHPRWHGSARTFEASPKQVAAHLTKWACINATMANLKRAGERADVYHVLTTLNRLASDKKRKNMFTLIALCLAHGIVNCLFQACCLVSCLLFLDLL